VAGPAPAPRLLGGTAELPWRTPDLDEHGAAVRGAAGETLPAVLDSDKLFI